MASNEKAQLDIFRLKIQTLLEQYVEKMKLFIADNKAIGMSMGGIKAIRDDDKSTWAGQLGLLEKNIKREVSGLINRIHIAVYMGKVNG